MSDRMVLWKQTYLSATLAITNCAWQRVEPGHVKWKAFALH